VHVTCYASSCIPIHSGKIITIFHWLFIVSALVYQIPFLQHFSDAFLFEGNVVGHLHLFPLLTLGLNW